MRVWTLTGVLALGACHLIGGYDDFNVVDPATGGSMNTGGDGASAGSGAAGAGGAACVDDQDCDTTERCKIGDCVDGTCTETNAPDGADCEIGTCDSEGVCHCASNADCDEVDPTGDSICIDTEACVRPYRWAVSVEALNTGTVNIIDLGVGDAGDVAIAVSHNNSALLVTSGTPAGHALPTAGDRVTVVSLDDDDAGELEWTGSLVSDVIGTGTVMDVMGTDRAFVAGTFNDFSDPFELTITSPIDSTIVAKGGTGPLPYIAVMDNVAAPLAIAIGDENAGITIDDLSCGSRCVLVGSYTDSFTISPHVAPTPPGGQRGCFAMAFTSTLGVAWVRWLESTTSCGNVSVHTTSTHAYVAMDLNGMLRVSECDPDCSNDPATHNNTGSGVVAVKLDIMSGAASLATGDETILQSPTIGALSNASAFASNSIGGELFNRTLPNPGEFDCALAFFDNNLANERVSFFAGDDNQFCDGTVGAFDQIVTAVTGAGDVVVDGTVEASVTGASGLIGWDPISGGPRWSKGFASNAGVGAARLATKPGAIALAVPVGNNQNPGVFEFADELTIDVPLCTPAGPCASVLLRMDEVFPPPPASE